MRDLNRQQHITRGWVYRMYALRVRSSHIGSALASVESFALASGKRDALFFQGLLVALLLPSPIVPSLLRPFQDDTIQIQSYTQRNHE